MGRLSLQKHILTPHTRKFLDYLSLGVLQVLSLALPLSIYNKEVISFHYRRNMFSSHNTQSQDTTGGYKLGSVLWAH
jgi:hypothetical protein